MDHKVLPLIQPSSKAVFSNEWRLQLNVLEKTIGFLDMQLEANLQRLEPQNQDESAWLDFCKTERPLILQEAREALQILRLLTNPQSHCDQS